jgi:hypothetical protein
MEKITIQYNKRGEATYVEIDGRKLTEPTHNLYEKMPPGVLKGTIDLGQIYVYELSDGKLKYCPHVRCHIF